jgi:hypothetical protein
MPTQGAPDEQPTNNEQSRTKFNNNYIERSPTHDGDLKNFEENENNDFDYDDDVPSQARAGIDYDYDDDDGDSFEESKQHEFLIQAEKERKIL